MFLTFKYRIKDSSARKHLSSHARAVNCIWNYCCETQRTAESRWKAGALTKWPTHYDLVNLTAGTSASIHLHSDSIGEACRLFVQSRNLHRKCPRFRSNLKSLGWIPLRKRSFTVSNDRITYLGRTYRFWKTRETRGEIKTGAFVEDARGRWYITFQCQLDETLPTGNGKIGIDLGLKAVATLSDGATIPALQHYRRYEAALASAQRAGNKRRVRAINAKIANSRKHHLHEWSTKIARENSLICVGNVRPLTLAKTKMAKSILDASWGILNTQLAYKASRHQAVFIVVDEAFTTRTCSDCGSIGGPEGIAGLGIRSWECSDCGASHDRDVNAARNILRIGLERQALVGEMPRLAGR